MLIRTRNGVSETASARHTHTRCWKSNAHTLSYPAMVRLCFLFLRGRKRGIPLTHVSHWWIALSFCLPPPPYLPFLPLSRQQLKCRADWLMTERGGSSYLRLATSGSRTALNKSDPVSVCFSFPVSLVLLQLPANRVFSCVHHEG